MFSLLPILDFYVTFILDTLDAVGRIMIAHYIELLDIFIKLIRLSISR